MAPRFGRTGLLTAGALSALLLTAGCSPPGSDDGQKPGFAAADGSVEATPTPSVTTGFVRQTKWGPVSAADQDLIRKVRLASLWEMPMAQEAMTRGRSARVRKVSAQIMNQHMGLDTAVRAIAVKLNVPLPIKPSAQQQQWIDDIHAQSGAEYDATYVKWLRLAHGQIFGLIGSVRGSTRNTMVRTFADACNKAVLNHQRLLESTGLTTASSFPTPPAVTPAPKPKPTN